MRNNRNGVCRVGDAADDAVGREGDERKRLARLSASPARARRLDVPERRLGLRRDERHEHAGASDGLGRQDPRAVRDRVRALRRRAAPEARRVPLVHAHDRLPEVSRRARPPALRRGRLPRAGLRRTPRGDGRAARGRKSAVHARCHGLRRGRRERADGLHVGPDGELRQLAWQAELRAEGVLLHARVGDLADGVDGERARDLRRGLHGRDGHRQGHGYAALRCPQPALREAGGDGGGRRGEGDDGERRGDGRAALARPSVVTGRAKPLRLHGRVRRGHGAGLLRDAQDRDAPRREGRPALLPQRRAGLPDGHARPGLVAGRTPHAAERRGDGVRHPDAEGPRLQHDAQTHQGRAGALLLPLRQDGADGRAGPAERERRRAFAVQGEDCGRLRPSATRAEGDDGHAADVPLDRDVGALQRRVEPAGGVPHARGAGLDEGP